MKSNLDDTISVIKPTLENYRLSLLKKSERKKSDKFKVVVFSNTELYYRHVTQSIGNFMRKYNYEDDYFEIEYINNKLIKECKDGTLENANDLVNRIKNSDVHFIASQGIYNSLNSSVEGWNIVDINNASMKLYYHKGYPNGPQLQCPIFNGDKWQYLTALSKYAIPSFKIPLIEDINDFEQKKLIKNVIIFVKKHHYGQGWFLKAPYTTNNLHFKGRSYSDVQLLISRVLELFSSNSSSESIRKTFSYLILQPTVPNRKEFKVIMHNGVCEYYMNTSQNKHYSPNKNSIQYVAGFEFAYNVFNELKKNLPHSIINGLIRIDFMKLENDKGEIEKYLLNEIEGIEADYGSANILEQNQTDLFLIEYWDNIVEHYLKDKIVVEDNVVSKKD